MHTIVVDLSYGDAGKGTTVDWLCSPSGGTQPVGVVRFNGGAQAAHNVVTPDRRHHTFAQFGSGTLWGVPTHLSRFMLVEPLALANEAAHLSTLGVERPLDLLTVEREALLTTPYHAAANRAAELARGAARHGSCGIGIGETMRYHLEHPGDAPKVEDCLNRAVLRRKLERMRDVYAAEHPTTQQPSVEDLLDAYTMFSRSVRIVGRGHLTRLLERGDVVFEGAQGVLLDEWRGFHPYTTWSTTTFENAETLLVEAGHGGNSERLGVVRTYTTRHGAGPLVTEDPLLTLEYPDRHNHEGRWQGGFRVGHFDAVAHRYAIEVAGGVDSLVLTHLDRDLGAVCDEYETPSGSVRRIQPGPEQDLAYQGRLTEELLSARPVLTPTTGDAAETVEELLGAPVSVTSSGPTHLDKERVRAHVAA